MKPACLLPPRKWEAWAKQIVSLPSSIVSVCKGYQSSEVWLDQIVEVLMINGGEVLARVHSGQVPSTWQVLYARSSYFVKASAVLGVLALVLIGGLIYLNQSDFVVLPGYGGGGSLPPDQFQTWRTIDYVVGGLLTVLFAGAAVQRLVELRSATKQMLVLLPEGFVKSTGKVPLAVAYTTVSVVEARSYRGPVSLRLKLMDGSKLTVRFDPRFGPVRPIAQSILVAQQQYMRAYPPKWERGAMKNCEIQLTQAMREEAKRYPNGYLYQIVGNYGPNEAVPPEAIAGCWKIDAGGNIVGNFIPNPNFKQPRQGRLGA